MFIIKIKRGMEMVKLKSPKQIAAKIKSLKKEISLLERAKEAETKAISAVHKASRAAGHKKKSTKRKKTRRPAKRKSTRKSTRKRR